MKTQFKLAALALVLIFNFQSSTLFAQGSLTPPGAPSPTMMSLDQIEPRTPISSAPYTISQPGSYYLSTSLAVNFGSAITIAASGVTLDLNGFTISSTEASPAGTGILLNGALSDITIANGHIRGGVTNNGSGFYSGSGFAHGIYYSAGLPVSVRVSRVSVSGCLNDGIYLNTLSSVVVENCTVRTVGSYGIDASIIKTSSATDCGNVAIFGDEVSDCRGQATGNGLGVSASFTALNCYGQGSGSGTGVSAGTALNCTGTSSSGTGVYASAALNCRGTSSSGTGVYATAAQNCVGSNDGNGTGVSTITAQNCYGYSGSSGTGVYASKIAIGCYGDSFTGTGLSAFIANVCSGSSISTAHNVNSY